MGIFIATIFAVLGIGLFISAKKVKIIGESIQLVTNIAGILAFIAAILVFIIPAATLNNIPTSTITASIAVHPSLLPTNTLIPSTISVAILCPLSHLGSGKQFNVTLQNGCYYHFNVACNGCLAGQENNYLVYYVGNSFQVTVSEGTVWQYSNEPSIEQFSSDCAISSNSFWPSQLPSFLNIPGIHQIWPCGVRTLPSTLIPILTIPATLSSYKNGSETFGAYPAYPPTKRQVTLGEGEIYVGTAVRFAARNYGCNTIDMNENIPLTAFIIRGPIQVDIEIDNGGWDDWVNVYNKAIAKNLLISKVNEVASKGKYIECIIPPFE